MSDLGDFHQDNVGYDNMKGGGEWPSKDTPPEEPAPGTDDDRREAIEAQRSGDAAPAGTGPAPEMQQDGSERGDRGPARTAEMTEGNTGDIAPPQRFKDVLDGNPAAAVRTTPAGEEGADERQGPGGRDR